MRRLRVNVEKNLGLIGRAAVCFLILTLGAAPSVFAQYRGAPVQQERLLKALRSRQLQTADIVAVINSNGVNFALTPELRRALLAAGARPEVIRAVENNRRFERGENFAKSKPRPKASATDYEELLSRAMNSYKDEKDSRAAARYLEAALKLKPTDPKAYQMLGFVNLYGLNDPVAAQKYMRQSIGKGGSAVFRVYHDDKGSFTERCTGSLYVSPEKIRFESDDNRHTFETSTVNVDRIKLDRESSKVWKNHTIFKVFLKIGKDRTRFRFAPVTGSETESQMVAAFVEESQMNDGTLNVAGSF